MPYLLLILTTLFWSGNFVLGKGMHAAIPPFTFCFYRWTVALIILSFFGIRHLVAQRELALKHKKYLILQGLLGVTGFNSFVYLAMQSTTAINAVLLNSCIPVIIVIISWVLYKDRLSLRQALGVCLSLSGVLFIMSGGHLATLLELELNSGDIFVLLAAICWAFYSVNLKKYPVGLHPFAYQSGIVITGLIALVPFYLMELSLGKVMVVSTTSVVTIIYVAVFASVLAFLFWNRAVSELGANVAGPFIHLMPVFSTILAVLFLGEEFTEIHAKAIVLIFSGIVLASYRTAPQKA
jgi:drug/metabolite transporter (DMT)-like permease